MHFFQNGPRPENISETFLLKFTLEHANNWAQENQKGAGTGWDTPTYGLYLCHFILNKFKYRQKQKLR